MNSKINFSCDYFFFDFFGTIMHRKCSGDDIKKIWSKRLSKKFLSTISSDMIYEVRRNTEKFLVGNQNNEFNYKNLIENIYYRLLTENKFILKNINIDSFYEICKKIELEIEIENQIINIDIIKVINDLKLKNKKIYILSDFYLSSDDLSYFLRSKNIDSSLFENIFVSSELTQNKLNGNIYDLIMKKLQIDCSKCFMIGDNKHSDYINAKKRGWGAYCIGNSKKYNVKVDSLKKLNSLVILSKKNGISYSNYAFTLFLFISKLYDELKKEKFNQVFFFAREGELLKKLFDIYSMYMFEKFGFEFIESKYLYVSRQATYLASLNYMPIESFDSLFKEYKNLSIEAFLKNLTFTNEEIEEINHVINLDFKSSIKNFEESIEFNQLKVKQEFINLYNNKLEKKKTLLINYLKKNGFFENEKVAVVDVGWKGSIQNNIFNAVKNLTIFGYYYGLNNSCVTSKSNIKKGLIFHAYPYDSVDYNLWSFDANFFERLLTASHPSTNGYIYENGSIVPLFNEFKTEKENYDLILPIQNNIINIFTKLVNNIYNLPILLSDEYNFFKKIHYKTACKVKRSNIILQTKLLMNQVENFGYQDTFKHRISRKSILKNFKQYYKILKDPIKIARVLSYKKFYSLSAFIYKRQYKKISRGKK